MDWLVRFGAAYVNHKRDPATQNARQYSGSVRGQSGLTGEQEQHRLRRQTAKKRLQQAFTVQRELRAYNHRDCSEFPSPRSWWQLLDWEQELMNALSRGDLRREYSDAKLAHGGAVAAPPFRM